MKFSAKVFVTLKQGVLDPQGAAVEGALKALGYDTVNDVRMGKYLTVALEAASREAASRQVEDMCRRLLANPVIEDFSFELAEVG